MTNASFRSSDNVRRAHHVSRKLVEHGRFQAGEGSESWVIGCACGKVNACLPSFLERIGSRIE